MKKKEEKSLKSDKNLWNTVQIQKSFRQLVDQIQLLFEEADQEHRNSLNLQQFQTLVQNKIHEFPQLEIFSKNVEKAFTEADKEKTGHLTLDGLRSVLEKADQKLRVLPATAQVAYQ
jgi:Ca2+-binding EF-hand superfamily protein